MVIHAQVDSPRPLVMQVLAFYQLQLETKQPFPIPFILPAYKMKLVENKTQITIV